MATHGPTAVLERRRRFVRRGLPALALVAVSAFAAGLALGGLGESEAERAAARFAAAWEKGDYAAMHALLTPASRSRTSSKELARAYEDAAETATVLEVSTGEPRESARGASFPARVRTRIFGTLTGEIDLAVEEEKVEWAPHLVLPGMPRDSELTRRTTAPERAAILARGGEVIAEGPASARTTALGEIAGQVGAPEGAEERALLEARGFPRDTLVGLSGLERILEEDLAGTPGGTLLAGGRVLASTEPRPAEAVRTTIDPSVQQAAVDALAGRFGGVAALDARTAEVRALAGIAFSAPQPPGSTFKIITATAALEDGLVTPRTPFPVETRAVIDGVELENANGESCGGTFIETFAHSCNSVFAPLGVRIGAERLVSEAEEFGFNQDPAIPGAIASTIPRADDIRSPLDLGSTAIGQGRVLATPLLLASMAQTIASEGVRREPTVRRGAARPRPVRVTTVKVARAMERLMIAVVESGTGGNASLAPVKVAGKTGTAELEDTTDDEPADPAAPPKPAGFDTDAWFTAYAPSRRPRIAVAVLLVRQGAGGDTAAPVARAVLQAGLEAER